MEPAGVASGSILEADRTSIALSSAVTTDVAAFETLLARAQKEDKAGCPAAAATLWVQALAFEGELLSGLYEPWVGDAQAHLCARRAHALCCLARYHLMRQERTKAATCVRRAVNLDPFCADLTPEIEDLLDDAEELDLLPFEPRTKSFALEHGFGKMLHTPSSGQASRKSRNQSNHRKCDSAKQLKRATPPEIERDIIPSRLQLSLPPTKFFGRERERESLRQILQDPNLRLLTLTGPGGIGKTRLALAAVIDWQIFHPETELHLISLADLRDTARVPAFVAQALGVSRSTVSKEADSNLREKIARTLNSSGRPIVLVLDNAEQVAEPVGTLLDYLLARVPTLTVVVTSRQKLFREAECEFQVNPLPTPPPGFFPPAGNWKAMLKEWPTIALFLDRARHVCPDVRETPDTAAALASLVNRLEGIPLAIELAAARSQVFSPPQMIRHLDKRFTLLVDRSKERKARGSAVADSNHRMSNGRHASLEAALNWSYDLLSPGLQRLFCSLSVFRGGCTPEAIAAVLINSEQKVEHKIVEGQTLLHDLEQLCNASLLRAEPSNEWSGQIRFVLLETLREFAEARLNPETCALFREHHAAFFTALAEEAEPHLQAEQADVWLAQLDLEEENLRVALDWASQTMTCVAARRGLRTASALHRYWLVRARVREGRERLATALSHPCYDGGWTPNEEATARNRAGVLAMTEGDEDGAETLYRDTLSLRRTLGDRRGIATTLNNLAILAGNRGAFAEARDLYTEALTLWRTLGDLRPVAVVLANLGGIDSDTGNLGQARVNFAESISLARSVGDARGAAISVRNIGIIAYREGRSEEASQMFHDSLVTLSTLSDVRGCAYSLLCLGLLAWQEKQLRRAGRLLRTALDAYAAFGLPLPRFAQNEIDSSLAGGLELPLGTVVPGTPEASAALNAVQTLSLILLDDWEEVALREPVSPPQQVITSAENKPLAVTQNMAA